MALTVGRAAALTGLSTKAIRLYESKGLLPEAERIQSGYRLVTEIGHEPPGPEQA